MVQTWDYNMQTGYNKDFRLLSKLTVQIGSLVNLQFKQGHVPV